MQNFKPIEGQLKDKSRCLIIVFEQEVCINLALILASNFSWSGESGCYICPPNFSKIGQKKCTPKMPVFVVAFKTPDERRDFSCTYLPII